MNAVNRRGGRNLAVHARLCLVGLPLTLAILLAGLGGGTIHAARAASVPAYDHIFFVIEENHSRAELVAGAPYLTGLSNSGARSDTYVAVTHPSVNNYLALFSGQTYGGITDNCTVGSGTCHTTAVNLADEVLASGRSSRGYMETMPSACYAAHDSGAYTERHNPFPYFDQIRTTSRCAKEIVPFTQLAGDLASTATTPNFVWITPDLNNDMHNGSVAAGDNWAKQKFPAIFTSPAWTTQHSLLVVTADEDDGSAGNNVTFFAVSSDGSVPAGKVSILPATHYSWLRTIEQAWGLPTMTVNDALALPMSDMFIVPRPTPTPSSSASPSPPISGLPTPPPSPAGAPPPLSCTRDAQGYWLSTADGGVFPIGSACGFGSAGGTHLNSPIAAMATTPDARGYWLVATDGGIFPFGDAGGFGSLGAIVLNQPVVAMAPTPTGLGYWLVAADGGVFPFGDAGGFGSTGGRHLNQAIVGIAATRDGRGYWLVAADGGIFPFGDAVGYGSTGGMRLNQRIVAMAATHGGGGYWLAAADGGIFPFGDAVGYGSTGGTPLNQPMVAMAAVHDGRGYWLVAADGGVFPFGDARGLGSNGGVHLNRPVVGMAATG